MSPIGSDQPLPTAVDSPTAVLAEFAADLRFEDLPASVVEHTKVCLVDTLGCGVFGASLPWTTLLRESLEEIDSTTDATVIGSATRMSAPSAALINGSAIHGFELDDLHAQSIVHPGSVILPAVLAAVELSSGSTGRDVITAVVAGIEVAARVGMSVGAAHLLQGFHPTGTHGALGAAAAAGSILKLSPSEMTHALGIAGTQSAGLMAAQFSSMVKRFHAGRAAQSGLYAALLARRGYTGIVNLFDVEYGSYGTTLSPQFDQAAVTANLGETWETLAVGFKPYSTNGSCHPTIDALLDMRAEHGINTDNVAAVRLRVSSATHEHVGWPYEPDSVTTAQMNLSYIVSVVLADGDAFVAQFEPHRINDPALVAFSRRVSVTSDPDIDAEGDQGRHHTFIEVELTDGRVLTDERRFARGNRRRPLTAEEVNEKFDKLVHGLIDRPDAESIKRIVSTLESHENLGELLTVLGRDLSTHRISAR